jgi:hypothetical protein
MSTGLGRIERTILVMVNRTRRSREGELVWLDAEAVARETYKGTNVTRSQRVAVLRAMHSFVRKRPKYALSGGKGRSPLVLFRLDEWERVVKAMKTIDKWLGIEDGRPSIPMEPQALREWWGFRL